MQEAVEERKRQQRRVAAIDALFDLRAQDGAGRRQGDRTGTAGRATVRVVADASVAVKWAIPDPRREEHLDQALALLGDVRAGRVVLFQPPHWMAEVAAVLTRLQPAIAEDALDLLDAMELLQVVTNATVYKERAGSPAT